MPVGKKATTQPGRDSGLPDVAPIAKKKAATQPGRDSGRPDVAHLSLLVSLGERVRARRRALGLTLRDLGQASDLSERFLVLLEGGRANVSILRLDAIARALGTTVAALLTDPPSDQPPLPASRGPLVALLGLRGAGKTTLGSLAAARLSVPFIELDSRVVARAGMSLGEIFEMQGAAYFRRLEREELERLVSAGERGIVATSGSLVTDHDSFELVRRVAVTVWLRARPQDHFQRVIDQGDARPMANRAGAMDELKALLRARRALYELADHVIDTSALGLERSIDKLVKIVNAAGRDGSNRFALAPA
ncbi:shikimate kinase [Polyangium aurulentum]|uniref:shikimate kinase n=1 Tax=Polyangium aurulentum TaxID=2567896 RepID=UPI0010AE07F5|nr:shikimate kinase [Polyangium aurulentum]UQA58036.1 helix-turn-helix domain-containing protein [Polyangium aurulentum]